MAIANSRRVLIIGAALGLAAGALGWTIRAGTRPALGAPDPALPAFSQPLLISNKFVPFVPGAVKVFEGYERGVVVLVVETQLTETRDFAWNGAAVRCRTVEELEFRNGVRSGRQRTFLAQADEGAVWVFGEVEDAEPEAGVNETGGWIVGERTAADPVETVTGAAPAVFMPASPRAGDVWPWENTRPAFVTTSRVLSTRDTVSVPGRRHAGCLRIVDTDESDGTTETKWFAPGVGLVRTRAARVAVALRASTVQARR